MGKMNYALEKGQKPRLQISWKGLGWKNVTIKLDGMEIGKIPSKNELMEGWEFLLDKNTTLKVKLAKRFNSWELQVLVNGQPVPGSASDPNRRLTIAYGMVFFVTGVNIIAGIIAELLKIDFLLNNGLGIYSVIFGVIMGIMGLIAGSFTGLVIRIFILIPMFGGFSAIRELKERKQIELAV